MSDLSGPGQAAETGGVVKSTCPSPGCDRELGTGQRQSTQRYGNSNKVGSCKQHQQSYSFLGPSGRKIRA